MPPPANVRVNVQVPFPALVTGSGPITVTKVNGVWQIGFSVAQVNAIVPPSGDFPTDRPGRLWRNPARSARPADHAAA